MADERRVQFQVSASPEKETPSNISETKFIDNTSNLQYYAALGFERISQKTVFHMDDEEQIVYKVGQQISILNYEKRIQKFIIKSSKVQHIFCFSVSSNYKLMALGERTIDNNLQVSIYNFKTAIRVRLFPLENEKDSVVSLDFSKDSKYLIVVCSGFEHTVMFWQLDKSKKLITKKVKGKIVQMTFNPFSASQIVSIGPDEVKFWKLIQNDLKNFEPLPCGKYTFTCHCWYDSEKCVIGTVEGILFVIENGNLVKTMHRVFPDQCGIYSIILIERGFICAGDGGYFAIYERTFDEEYFLFYKRFQAFDKVRIVDLCSSKKQEKIICAYENNQMSLFPLVNLDILRETDSSNFTLLSFGFHGDVVVGSSLCIQKPIIVTASNDRMVRIWDYSKCTLELSKDFQQDEMFSVSLHPNGMLLLLGFKYKLALFSILQNDLLECCKWQVKSCKVVSFSTGGQYFAAASANLILIFSTYTHELVCTLKGHSGVVKSIQWSNNDKTLLSCGFEGAVYEWAIREERSRISENIIRSCTFQCAAYDDNKHISAVIGNDGRIWSFQNSELYCEVPTPYTLTCLCLAKHSKTLFVGTEEGKLLLFQWPLQDFHYREYHMHCGPIHHVMTSLEERFLFTISQDGSLFMMDYESMVNSQMIVKKEFDYHIFEDVVLASKSYILEKNSNIKELTEKTDYIKLEAERRMSKMIEEKNGEMEQQKLRFTEEIKELDKQIDSLKLQISENETAFKDKLTKMEVEHSKAIDEFEHLFEKSMDMQQEKYKKLDGEKSLEITNLFDKIHNMEKLQRKEIEKLKEEYEHERLNQMKQFESLSRDVDDIDSAYKATLDSIHQEHEKEVEVVKESLTEEIKKEKQEAISARGKAIVHKSRVEELQIQNKDLERKLKFLENELAKVRRKAEDDSTVIQNLKSELSSRDDTILLHEKRISELKSQRDELEKIRYVLTFKFNKLKKEVTPKQDLIDEMRTKIRSYDTESQKMILDKENLKGSVKVREERLDVLHNELAKTKQNLEEKKRLITLLVKDLDDLASKGDLKQTNLELKKVVTKYSKQVESSFDSEQKNKEKLREFERHRDYMEEQLKEVKKTLIKKEVNLRADVTKKTSENSVLVTEINDLRKENKDLTQKVLRLELQLKELSSQHQQQGAAQRRSFSHRSNSTGRPSTSNTTATSSFSSLQIRPESAIPSIGNSKSSTSGRLIRGSTVLSAAKEVSLQKSQRYMSIIQDMEKNTKKFEQQQQEISKLKDYVDQLMEMNNVNEESDDIEFD